MENDDVLDPSPSPRRRPRRGPKAPPIESRFLFVDVAAMRAKQLRRGALPRLDDETISATHRVLPHKAERIAMEEVKRGLVLYDVPRPLQSARRPIDSDKLAACVSIRIASRPRCSRSACWRRSARSSSGSRRPTAFSSPMTTACARRASRRSRRPAGDRRRRSIVAPAENQSGKGTRSSRREPCSART